MAKSFSLFISYINHWLYDTYMDLFIIYFYLMYFLLNIYSRSRDSKYLITSIYITMICYDVFISESQMHLIHQAHYV